IVLEEKRARSGVQQRIEDYIYERLAPESTFGRRLPIGTEATIKAVTPRDFQDFYARWYAPSNMTVIAVGDIDPPFGKEGFRRTLAGGRTGRAPVPRDA